MHEDVQLGQHPKVDHIKWPDHWQVMEAEAALGNLLYATHVLFHDPHHGAVIYWESRLHRKGRADRPAGGQHASQHTRSKQPPFPRLVGIRLKDMSWWIAAIYMIGSAVFIFNGAFGFFMLGSKTVNTYVNGYSALFGTICFQVGGIFLMMEALNAEPEVRIYNMPGGSVAAPDTPGQQGSIREDIPDVGNIQPHRHEQLSGISASSHYVEGNTDKCRDSGSCYCYGQQQLSVQVGKSCTSSPVSSLTPTTSPSSSNIHSTLNSQQRQQQHSLSSALPIQLVQPCAASLQNESCGKTCDCHCRHQLWQESPAGLPCIQLLDEQDDVQASNPCVEIVLDPQSHISGMNATMNGHVPAMEEQKSPTQADNGVRQLSKLQKFKWWGFKWRDLGWLASFVQCVSSAMFGISNVAAVPGILPKEDEGNYALWDGLVWSTTVLGSFGFLVSSALFTLETQKRWWKPRPSNLGWHAGFWNVLGSIGFTLSGVFGFFVAPQDKYQHWGLNFCTLWGSCFFLLGSYLHLIEALNKDL